MNDIINSLQGSARAQWPQKVGSRLMFGLLSPLQAWIVAIGLATVWAVTIIRMEMPIVAAIAPPIAQRIAEQTPSEKAGLWQSINGFSNNLFSTSDFTVLGRSGNWTLPHAWLHAASDSSIWLLSMVMSLAIFCHLRKKPNVCHAPLFRLLAVLIVAFGSVQLFGAVVFWWPAYRFMGITKALTAVICIIAALKLIPAIPRVMTLRSFSELQLEIAQRRRTESELRQVHLQLEGVIERRTAELAAKNEELEQFLNTVSHDLKSPVVTCLGLVGMLREDVLAGRNGDSQDTMSRIERSVSRMQVLIDDLLNLSRIGRIQFETVEVDMMALVLSIGDDLKSRIEQAGGTLQIEGRLPSVQGDRHWLMEVFENLIINALKYGCDNANPRITVGSMDGGTEDLLYVRDNGRGIDSAQHQHIFEPFKRLRNDKEGSGMGLAIVARIIKMHKGRVWVESEPEKGATFWVALPKAAPVANNAWASQTIYNKQAVPCTGASHE